MATASVLYMINLTVHDLKDMGDVLLLVKVSNNENLGMDPLLVKTQSGLLTTQRKKIVENIVGRGENAGNQHFLLFQQ